MLLFLPDSTCSPVHCVCQFGECLAYVGRRKCSAHIWEWWLMLGPLGSAAPSLSNPGAHPSSLGASGSNPRHRTVKTHLVRGRRADWEAVLQFTAENRTKMHFALTLRTKCSLSSFLCLSCITACLWMCPTYWPYMKSIECFGWLVTEQHISCSYMNAVVFLEIKEQKHENVETKHENNIQGYRKE